MGWVVTPLMWYSHPLPCTGTPCRHPPADLSFLQASCPREVEIYCFMIWVYSVSLDSQWNWKVSSGEREGTWSLSGASLWDSCWRRSVELLWRLKVLLPSPQPSWKETRIKVVEPPVRASVGPWVLTEAPWKQCLSLPDSGLICRCPQGMATGR